MKYNLSRIGLGLAAVGRPEYINVREHPDEDKSELSYRKRAMNLLDFAYDNGVRDFDTAASYGKGESFLKQWYHDKQYSDVRLSSKWGYTYKANWEIGYQGAHEVKEHSIEKLREQWLNAKDLLPGLKTYQIHSATFESGVLENKTVLEELHQIKTKTGIQMGVSVSGEDQKSIVAAAASIQVDGRDLFDSFQVTYNLLDATTHDVLRDLLVKEKTVIVKEALANGRLIQNNKFPQYDAVYKELERLASKYGVGADAIALRFVMDSLQPTLVLSGAATKNQLQANLKAQGIQLSPKEILSLKQFQIEAGSYWKERKNLDWN